MSAAPRCVRLGNTEGAVGVRCCGCESALGHLPESDAIQDIDEELWHVEAVRWSDTSENLGHRDLRNGSQAVALRRDVVYDVRPQASR